MEASEVRDERGGFGDDRERSTRDAGEAETSPRSSTFLGLFRGDSEGDHVGLCLDSMKNLLVFGDGVASLFRGELIGSVVPSDPSACFVGERSTESCNVLVFFLPFP